jgi:protein TonB
MPYRILSLLLHLALVAILLLVGPVIAPRIPEVLEPAVRETTRLIAPLTHRAGGGQRDPRPVARGEVKYTMRKVFVLESRPPVNREPRLIIDSGFQGETPRDLPEVAALGDPLGFLRGGGPGGGRNGLGSDQGEGGLGPNSGRGVDATAVTARYTVPPVLVYKTEPEYSDEARKVKWQGTVIVLIEIDERGEVRRARVAEGAGMGLDERAVEAVRRWRFKPALRDGKPVPAPARVEVSFHLL